MQTVRDFIFLGWKITADGDHSHEIKRCLLLGRKAMTNLDSVLKSRDITWLTKVRLIKAIGFPIVMYGCESWSIKKAEHFWTVVLEKTLESPLDCKEIQPVHPKGNQFWIFIGRTDAESGGLFFKYKFIYFMEANYFSILYWFCHTLTWICHGCTRVPHPEPPPTSLPIPSLWVIPVHQPRAPCIMHRTWTGNSFHIW